MGIPDCLTIASTSYKNSYQYAGVPFTELIKEKVLLLATKLSMVPLKLFFNVPSVSVRGLIFCIAKFIHERKRCCSYTGLAKNI